MALSEAEIARYARQLLLPGLGEMGQERLRSSRVKVWGAGPLAGPALVYLAEAGVGAVIVEEAGAVAPADRAGWLYGPSDEGRPRLDLALESVDAANRFVYAEPEGRGPGPTAGLICLESADATRAAARAAFEARLPHVVAEVDGEGGAVTVVPVGGPCFECSFRPGSGRAGVAAGYAAASSLGALELAMLLACLTPEPRGRRIDLLRGHPSARATVRQPGCSCASGRSP
ncbi:MAG TPA: ThiF family adenylyltransferase [Anaeromyxobacteraceae bacterium]|jgi:adenylyltransferase/sulfurtransferase|nr:ThiF family adenylyltransferase [Anaeromyxobacteraceae bacterium]